METVDHSVEQAFFAQPMLLSDRPVWFDTDDEESDRLDLEGREQRRAHFARVVSVVVGALGVVALLALLRPARPPAEAARVVVAAARPNPVDLAPAPQEEPTLTLPLELTAEEPVAAPSSAVPAPSSSAGSSVRAVKGKPAAPARRAPRIRAQAPKSPSTSSPPVQTGNLQPPTARFAD